MTATTTRATTEARFTAGALVTARGRDWVVLPDSDDVMLVLRPLAGGDDDICAVLPALEDVSPATFGPPDPDDLGDDRSARLLRDALRVGFRCTGGPFRCLAALAVTPRPYQLVPLLLALRQDVVRLLIADDVGIGKTIEAGLIASELLAQGSARGLTVLCPPSLAPQWQEELRTKFGLDAELVLPGTVRRLERALTTTESVFDRYPVTIVSTDFIKSDRRRNEFLRTAPDLVIVDEAHGCVSDDRGAGNSGRTQRHRLLRDIAADPQRHLLLVTATPHSGHEATFRNLIGLLNPRLAEADLTIEDGRRLLADHMVQRRRADIRHYLRQDTTFPSDRLVDEQPYTLTEPYRSFLDDILAYVRGQVQDRSGSQVAQRVRWWSALSLLRSVASSPAAAAATLTTRSASVEATSSGVADLLGASEVLDGVDDEAVDGADATPGALAHPEARPRKGSLLDGLRARAEDLAADPASDAKLNLLIRQIKRLHTEGFHPIVFCRFIPTAHYVTAALRQRLPASVAIEVVTGELAADERATRVAGLVESAGSSPKVLIATDCLSEGVNLQADFQAVVHYDLAWNPTRHEQREGRVDRFGQPRDTVKTVLLYGADTGIDGIILDVLLRKHEAIRKDLGISVAVPPRSDQILSALLEGVLLRGREAEQLTLDLHPDTTDLDEQWRSTAEAERRSRSRFAQASIQADEVEAALVAARHVMGEPDAVAALVETALTTLGADLITRDTDGFTADVTNTPVGLRDALALNSGSIAFRCDLPAPRGTAVLHRTDPLVTRLARYVLDGALDTALPAEARPARRCGLIATDSVDRFTTVLLLRVRAHLSLPGRYEERTQVAEEARVIAFTGPPTNPDWLAPAAVELLLSARPTANIERAAAHSMMTGVLAALPALDEHLNRVARDVAAELHDAHATVRRAARGDRAGRLGLQGLRVSPQLPVDILGVYALRPAGGRS